MYLHFVFWVFFLKAIHTDDDDAGQALGIVTAHVQLNPLY